MTSTLTHSAPTLGRIVRHAGIAGQFALSVAVSYAGEPASVVTFTHSTYGGPVIVSFPGFPGGVFVSSEVIDRCGSQLSPEWVRRYFRADDAR